MGLNVDFDFIANLEGGCKTQGYVPEPERSDSGVTIASGLDLGARNENDLRLLGISQSLISRFRPYLGLKRNHAQRALQSKPLRITDYECIQVEQSVKTLYISQLANRYNHAIAPGKTQFENLPPQIQTVITSVSFQHGLNLAHKAPKFWSAVTEQDWPRAVAILKNFGDLYRTRRSTEAKLMEQVL